MFNRNEILIYKPPHQKRGIPIGPMECEFLYIDSGGSAAILVKQSVGKPKRRYVNPKYLSRQNEIQM